jgi:hypothetical protein
MKIRVKQICELEERNGLCHAAYQTQQCGKNSPPSLVFVRLTCMLILFPWSTFSFNDTLLSLHSWFHSGSGIAADLHTVPPDIEASGFRRAGVYIPTRTTDKCHRYVRTTKSKLRTHVCIMMNTAPAAQPFVENLTWTVLAFSKSSSLSPPSMWWTLQSMERARSCRNGCREGRNSAQIQAGSSNGGTMQHTSQILSHSCFSYRIFMLSRTLFRP